MQVAGLPWDLGAILFLLGVVVPWRGAVRVRALLARTNWHSTDRIVIYASTIALQWLLCTFTAWRCVAHGWTEASLGLALPAPSTAIFVGLALASLLAVVQFAALRQLPRVPPEGRGRLYQIARKLMPQTLTDGAVFVVLVCTVSLCEEFLYRGFVFSVFARAFHGSTAAAILGSSVFFAGAHWYQGRRGIINTFFLGAVFAAVRLWTGSLLPSILAHFAVDLMAGLGASRWPRETAAVAVNEAQSM